MGGQRDPIEYADASTANETNRLATGHDVPVDARLTAT